MTSDGTITFDPTGGRLMGELVALDPGPACKTCGNAITPESWCPAYCSRQCDPDPFGDGAGTRQAHPLLPIDAFAHPVTAANRRYAEGWDRTFGARR